MCRIATVELAASLSSAPSARRWMARQLRHWEVADDVADVATLLSSELVANAVVHARSGPIVSVALTDGMVEVGVSDPRPEMDRIVAGPSASRPVPTPGAEAGRGLVLVDRLAAEWGVTALPTGKQVWFRLPTPGWPYPCRCPEPGVALVTLGSGRSVHPTAGPWDRHGSPPPG